MLFRRLVWLALGIALVVGSLQSFVQHWQAMPIIQAAEKFEDQKLSVAPAAPVHDHADHAAHSHGEQWAPQDGYERLAWTWVANVMLAFGLALLMLAVLGTWTQRRGGSPNPLRAGLIVALAGFVSFYLWPTVGLPPEIPGMDAARLGSRQGWWLLAASCATSACALIAVSRQRWRWIAALVLLAVPFLVGAPHVSSDPLAGFPADAATQLRALSTQFVWASALASAVQWLALGLLCGLALKRWLLPALTVAANGEPPATIASQVRG